MQDCAGMRHVLSINSGNYNGRSMIWQGRKTSLSGNLTEQVINSCLLAAQDSISYDPANLPVRAQSA